MVIFSILFIPLILLRMEDFMQNEFYIMRETYTNYADAVQEEQPSIVEECPVCGAISDKRIDEKYKVHFEGKKVGDYYFAPICSIVSKRMLQILKDNEITGFEEREIECTGWYDRKGNALPIDFSDFMELKVVGRAGRVLNLDGKELKHCPKCNAIKVKTFRETEGLSVGDDWDGSDIFYFTNWRGVMIVTQKVKDLLESNKMKNVDFIRLSEYEAI